MHGGIFGVDGKLSVIVAITLVLIGDLANVGIRDTSNLDLNVEAFRFIGVIACAGSEGAI